MYAEMNPEVMVRQLESGRGASDLMRDEMVSIFLEYETQGARILRRACDIASDILKRDESHPYLLRAVELARARTEDHEARAAALSACRVRFRRASGDRLAAEKRASTLCAKCAEADTEFWRQRRRRHDTKDEKLELRDIVRSRDAAKRRAGRAYRERLEDRSREAAQVLDAIRGQCPCDAGAIKYEEEKECIKEPADCDRLFSAALRVLDWDWSRRQARSLNPDNPAHTDSTLDLFSSSDDMWSSATPAQRLDALAIAGSRRLRPRLSRRQAERAAACLGYVISNDDASLVHRALALATTFEYCSSFLSAYPRVRTAVEARRKDATFLHDVLVASLAAELDSSATLKPIQWDDPSTCTESQLVEAVATIHALLFAKIPAIARDITLAASEDPDKDQIRRDFIKGAAERAQLPHFLSSQLLSEN